MELVDTADLKSVFNEGSSPSALTIRTRTRLKKNGNPQRRKKGRKPARSLAELYLFHQGHCRYCGCATVLGGEGDNAATRDHVVPKSRGGKQAGNLVLACARCNSMKSNRTVADLRNTPLSH